MGLFFLLYSFLHSKHLDQRCHAPPDLLRQSTDLPLQPHLRKPYRLPPPPLPPGWRGLDTVGINTIEARMNVETSPAQSHRRQRLAQQLQCRCLSACALFAVVLSVIPAPCISSPHPLSSLNHTDGNTIRQRQRRGACSGYSGGRIQLRNLGSYADKMKLRFAPACDTVQKRGPGSDACGEYFDFNNNMAECNKCKTEINTRMDWGQLGYTDISCRSGYVIRVTAHPDSHFVLIRYYITSP